MTFYILENGFLATDAKEGEDDEGEVLEFESKDQAVAHAKREYNFWEVVERVASCWKD
jgi:hypothetical protein